MISDVARAASLCPQFLVSISGRLSLHSLRKTSVLSLWRKGLLPPLSIGSPGFSLTEEPRTHTGP